MLEEALVVLVYIALIVFIIALIVLCIKLIGTLSRADKLIENITRKAESLDGVFDMIDYTSNKFGAIGETVVGFVTGMVKKLFNKKNEREDESYE
jgi:uncharacterized membrane protein